MNDAAAASSKESTTFVIQIKFNQNATWQGSVTWLEQRQEKHFRSELELLRLMDSAVGTEPAAW